MSKIIAFAAAVVGLCAFGGLVVHAKEVSLQVNPGLWEVVTAPQVSGQLPIPESEFAQLPPDQRAKFAAAMQAMMAKQNQPRKYKECVTRDDLAKGFQVGKRDGSCTRTVLSQSASALEVSEKCTSDEGSSTGHYSFQANGMQDVSGTINMQIMQEGKTMMMNNTIKGHWLSANCGNVKDLEVEQ